jgi:Cu-processing system permease protein
MSEIWWIGRQEFTLNRRNRWVLCFSGLFSILTLIIAYFGMVTSGYAGFQDFIRTAASIVNLAGFLIPLFALLLGVFSFTSNTEYLELLSTQPLSRSRVLLGKYLGLVMTVLVASVVGFGLPGIIIALVIGPAGALSYLVVVGYSLLLALVFTGISVLISLLSGRTQLSVGIALGVWILFEVVYGVVMLATTLYLTPGALQVVLIGGLLGNPIDTVRVLSLLQVGGVHLFGPGGATLIKLTGSATVASMIGLLGVALWAVAPVLCSIRVFRTQDL